MYMYMVVCVSVCDMYICMDTVCISVYEVMLVNVMVYPYYCSRVCVVLCGVLALHGCGAHKGECVLL